MLFVLLSSDVVVFVAAAVDVVVVESYDFFKIYYCWARPCSTATTRMSFFLWFRKWF